MKKYLFILFITSGQLFSQTDPPCMNFLNCSWDSLKTIANNNHKFIFIDAYTDWCGWCKYMDKHTFNNDTSCQFYNENFMNYKFNMEEGDGISFAQQYNVYAYPAQLYFDSLGYLLYKSAGYKNPREFIELGKFISSLTIQNDTIWTALPNPFISSTNIILYNLAADTITLQIYNRWGQIIATYFSDTILSGTITITFNADTLPDEIYIAYFKKNSETYGKNLVKTITASQSEIHNLKFDITTFPNPVSETLTISLSSDLKNCFYEIYDLTGRKIERNKITESKQIISLKNYGNGIYFLKISDGVKIYTEKFIKE